MSEMPWFRFYASDWLAGTRSMTAAETGVYITLIASMYERCEPVPEDHKRLSRLCGIGVAAFKTIVQMLVDDGKIIRVDGGLWNKRAENEINFRDEKSQAAARSADARWNKKSNEINGCDNANAMPTQCERNANQKPDTRIQKETHSAPEGFTDWYASYPLKVGRGQAVRAYVTASKKASPEVLLDAAKKFATACVGKDRKFIPHPATWLNGERWLDDPPAEQSGAGGDSGKVAHYRAIRERYERAAG